MLTASDDLALVSFPRKATQTSSQQPAPAFLYGSGNQASVSSPHVATGRALKSYFLKELLLPTLSLTALKELCALCTMGEGEPDCMSVQVTVTMQQISKRCKV